ncbi:MAG: CPBP family intramembrane glutamic endopeptidase [Chthoniobacteraceae bacterium]
MKEIRKILLFLIGSALLGALLAPWLYWGGKWLAERTHWEFLIEADFHKFFDRAVLIAAVLLLWPVFRSMKIGSAEELGITRNPRGWQHLRIGFIAGFVCMAAFAGLMFYLGVYRLKSEPPWTALFKIALSAGVVATLEEWLFRGVILGFFRKALVDWPAVFCTSMLFSIVHFLKPPSTDAPPSDWLEGLRVLPTCFEKFSEPALLGAGFTTLFLVGWVLGWSVLRTRSLWLGIGLHAGWVFTKFGFTKLTKRSITDTMPWLGEDLIVGLGALAVVACSWFLAWLWLNYADSRSRAARW